MPRGCPRLIARTLASPRAGTRLGQGRLPSLLWLGNPPTGAANRSVPWMPGNHSHPLGTIESRDLFSEFHSRFVNQSLTTCGFVDLLNCAKTPDKISIKIDTLGMSMSFASYSHSTPSSPAAGDNPRSTVAAAEILVPLPVPLLVLSAYIRDCFSGKRVGAQRLLVPPDTVCRKRKK